MTKLSDDDRLNRALKTLSINKGNFGITYNNPRCALDGIDYSFEEEYHCDEENCGSDICRCSTIVNTSVKIDIDRISNSFTKYLKNEINQYCCDRIIHLARLEDSDFTVNICSGYYGEEIEGVSLSKEKVKFISDNVLGLLNKNNIEKIKLILKLEYGYLHNFLKQEINLSIQKIDTKLILIKKSSKIEDCSHLGYGKDYQHPMGIVKKVNNNYSVIDGNHRINEAIKNNLKKINLIVLEEKI